MFFIISVFFVITGVSQESISYYKATTDHQNISELKEIEFSTIEDTNLGTDNGIYWFKIDAIDLPRSILELQTSHVKEASLYDVNGQKIGQMDATRYPSFFIINKIVEYPLYLKADFPLEAHFPIQILDENTFAKKDKKNFLGIGFFYGTALALLLATLIFLLTTQNKQFLFYGILIAAVCISIMTRDNILYFFNAKPSIISSIELLGHFLVGLCATGYVFRYLRIKNNKKLIESIFVIISSISFISLCIYWITNTHWSFLVTDFTTVLSVVLLWSFTLYNSKNTKYLLIMIAIYTLDIIVLTDAFLLHGLGKSFFDFSSLQLSIVSLVNFTLIALALIFSFRRIQGKTVIMKHQIKMHLERLSQLSTYKNVQDSNDQYIESLIHQFELENIEIKVLDGISKGLTNERIATKHNLSVEKLKTVTSNLYQKLGIESDQEATGLFT
ncbi:7TM diverse intracellular signaling domain-containing protein [uncultured Dokdonia sp.]|uniref:helix-turn-helix transcriptional regulator n=1 Tax=uncultured Dokdonia sp. TaxID=575653 RepID=UPI002616509B|nr:7TM diverse intracellular signaling domain-containing protein [uncultured Dokdonia sp.]